MSVEAKTTHVADAQARLIHALRDVPRLDGILVALAGRTQTEETIAQQLRTLRWLDNASGTQLDGIGEIVGEERAGKSDTDYRVHLAIRIRVNKISGTTDQLLEVAALLVGASRTSLERWDRASFVMTIADAITAELATQIVAILGEARAAGVRGVLEYSTSDDDETLMFASADSSEQALNGFAGTDLLYNGSFEDGWTGGDPDGWTVSESLPNFEVSNVGSGVGHGGGGGGSCNIYANSTGTVYLEQTIAVVSGSRYIVELDISYWGYGIVQVQDVGANTEFFQTYSATGVKTIEFVATGSSITLRITNGGGWSVDATIDDIAVTTDGGVMAACEEL